MSPQVLTYRVSVTGAAGGVQFWFLQSGAAAEHPFWADVMRFLDALPRTDRHRHPDPWRVRWVEQGVLSGETRTDFVALLNSAPDGATAGNGAFVRARKRLRESTSDVEVRFFSEETPLTWGSAATGEAARRAGLIGDLLEPLVDELGVEVKLGGDEILQVALIRQGVGVHLTLPSSFQWRDHADLIRISKDGIPEIQDLKNRTPLAPLLQESHPPRLLPTQDLNSDSALRAGVKEIVETLRAGVPEALGGDAGIFDAARLAGAGPWR